jgi:hypothetical protein
MAIGKNRTRANGVAIEYTNLHECYLSNNGNLVVWTKDFVNTTARISGKEDVLPRQKFELFLSEESKNKILSSIYEELMELPEFEGGEIIDPDEWKNEPQIGEGE